MSSTTTYKGISIATQGSDAGSWGTIQGTGFATIDSNLGGISTVALSATDVSLSSEQSSSAIIRFTGTLTNNIQVTTLCQGFQFCENKTTGAFSVTYTNGVGSTVVIPQGVSSLVISDTANGCRFGDSGGGIPSGSKTVWYQASAPTGWTQDTSLNDYTIRIVSGTGGGHHSGLPFSSIVASGTVNGHAVTVNEMPSHTHADLGHTHPVPTLSGYVGGSTGTGVWYSQTTVNSSAGYANIQNTGSGQAHTHTFTSGPIDFNYIDAILCTKV